MKKIIEEVLESEQVLTLRDKSNRRYITGLIMEAIREEGWFLDVGSHRPTSEPLAQEGDGMEDGQIEKRRVKSYGFFKNEYYDD